MTKPKVLLLGKLPPPYMGPSIATEIILKSSLKEHFELIHLDTKINHEISAFGTWSFGKVFRNLSIYFKMISLARKMKPDIVLVPISQTTTGFFKDSLFILIAKFFGRKIILQLRGSNFKTWISNSSSSNKWYVKYILKKTQGIIVLGNNLKHLFENYYPKDKIFVVPNGGDYTFPIKNESGEVKILYLSNLLASKGIEDVFRAIEIVSKKTDVKFSIDIIGSWYNIEEEKRCLSIKESSHLPINVHLSKGLDEKFKYLANADIFVFPPREPEGHPWSIVEAMAAGLPIISTDMGAIIESVIDGKNGFIVEPKHPEQIAEKLELLIKNEGLRKNMGAAGRELYLANFTEAKMVEKLTATFNNIIEK
ncbi:MAG TPA: glycosyltransferase [Bacteroidia bacterium]|jgi:glycosyltransferase involved in cell wall biosynthesis|nr:glycosyltransferase [Bacteroidia bacterium]